MKRSESLILVSFTLFIMLLCFTGGRVYEREYGKKECGKKECFSVLVEHEKKMLEKYNLVPKSKGERRKEVNKESKIKKF